VSVSGHPSLVVEISFVSAPLATGPTWVDVSQWVRDSPGVSIVRGRSSEFGAFPAGRCSLVLSNRDRRFDPSFAAGPYFGGLTPRRQIRVRCVWSATTYDLFTGWVTGWPQSFGSGGLDATVAIEAIDGLAWLADVRLSSDPVKAYVTSLGVPSMFLRTADGSSWSDVSGGLSVTPRAGVCTFAASLNPAMASTTVTFTGTQSWNVASSITTSSASWAFWVRTTSTTQQIVTAGVFSAVLVGPTVRYSMGGTNADSSLAVNDGAWHHVVVVTANAGASSTVTFYIDGVVDRAVVIGVAVADSVNCVGNHTFAPIPLTGSLQDVIVWGGTQLTATQVANVYNLSRGYFEEDTTTRATRYLDDVGWPAAWRDLTTTPEAVCGQLLYNSQQALTALQELERTEQGRIFASKINSITLQSRYYTQEVTRGKTVQAIFSDDGADTPYENFGFVYDDIDMQNDITVATPTFSTRSQDTTSITNYGRQSETINTILTTVALAGDMAAGLVNQRKTPMYRSQPVTIHPEVKTAQWATLLNLELGDRVQFEITPMATAPQHVESLTLEQIQWRIGEGDSWELVVLGSPVPTGFFLLDTSSLDGPDFVGY
jgi:Concanavalin A-like lectin/glucanases superfamily